MPIYDYACTACGHTTEVIHGIHEVGPRFCPNCGAEGSLKKAFAAPAVHFKGSGWAKKDRSATSSPGKAAKTGKDATGTADGGSGAAGGSGGETGAGTDGGSQADAPAPTGATTKAADKGSSTKSDGARD